MVLVFFVVNLLRIDLYDVVKEIKKGRDTMKTIIKRSILDYLKNPVLWIGLIIIVASMYQCLSSYLQIHYIKQNEQITQNDVALEDADVMDGYIPTSDDKERRREWEDTIKETLMDTSKNGFGFSRQEADHVMKEIQNMDVKTASEFWNPNMAIIMQYMLMRTLKFIRGQQKKSIIISSGNYPNILFPGTLPKNLRILQDCIWPFLQQSCYHFYLFRIHEKIPMNYYIQSLLRQSNIYVGK